MNLGPSPSILASDNKTCTIDVTLFKCKGIYMRTKPRIFLLKRMMTEVTFIYQENDLEKLYLLFLQEKPYVKFITGILNVSTS